MILIGIGSNLASPNDGAPRQIVDKALALLEAADIRVLARSAWYRSEPVPPSGQPWFVNGVAAVASRLPAAALLRRLQSLEDRFGRRRGARNAARTLDLDLLDYDGQVIDTPHLVLPHPRLHQRRFVLEPLAEIAPRWRHPLLGLDARSLLARLGPAQPVYRLPC